MFPVLGRLLWFLRRLGKGLAYFVSRHTWHFSSKTPLCQHFFSLFFLFQVSISLWFGLGPDNCQQSHRARHLVDGRLAEPSLRCNNSSTAISRLPALHSGTFCTNKLAPESLNSSQIFHVYCVSGWNGVECSVWCSQAAVFLRNTAQSTSVQFWYWISTSLTFSEQSMALHGLKYYAQY